MCKTILYEWQYIVQSVPHVFTLTQPSTVHCALVVHETFSRFTYTAIVNK